MSPLWSWLFLAVSGVLLVTAVIVFERWLDRKFDDLWMARHRERALGTLQDIYEKEQGQ